MDESLLKTSHKNQQYDPFLSPPDLKKAHEHKLATSVGRDVDDEDKDFHICPCCENVIEKHQIPLNCSDEDLLFLGVGYPLYYKLTRYFGIIIFLIFLVSGSGFYFLVTLNCTKECIYFFGIPIINLEISGVDSAHKADIVNLVAAFAIFVGVLYVKSKIRLDIEQLQKKVVSPDQYTIMLHNLPENINQQDIIQWCKQNFQAKPILINFAFNVNQLANAYKNRQQMTIKLNKKLIDKSLEQNQVGQQSLLNTQIQQLKQNIRGMDNLIQLYREQKVTCHKIGTVFVTFSQQTTANKILQKYQNSTIKLFVNKLLSPFKNPPLLFRSFSVIVTKAPGPREVIWQNLQYSFLRNVLSDILFVLVMVLVLFFSFHFQFIVVELAYQLRHRSSESGQVVAIIQALAMSVLVVIINSLLRLLIKLFAYIKRYYSYSSYHSAFCFYYSISYIFNTCFMIYIVHGHLKFNEQKPLQQQNILIYDIHLIMLANAFSEPLYKVIDFQMWFRFFRRNYIKNLSKNNKNPYTQSYANVAWEGYEMQVADNYQYIFRTVVITTWFAHSAPLGVVFSLVGLFIDYWIGKYLLLRHYKRPQTISKQIAVPMIMSLELLPLVYICGVLQFTYKVSDSANIFTFMYQFLRYGVTILIILVCILGYLAIYKPNSQSTNPIKYDEVQSMFPYNYQTQNPITKFKGQMKYLYGVLKHGTNSSQQKLIKDFLTLSGKNRDSFAQKQSAILKIKRKKLKRLETLQQSQQYKSMQQYKQGDDSDSSDTSNKRSQNRNIFH